MDPYILPAPDLCPDPTVAADGRVNTSRLTGTNPGSILEPPLLRDLTSRGLKHPVIRVTETF